MRRGAALAFAALRVAAVAGVVAFMFAPTAVMAVLSFSNETSMAFPPPSWGLRQYREALFGDRWHDPLLRSLAVGGASAALAFAVGLPALAALHRTRVRGRGGVRALAVGPLLVPALAYAIALYAVFSELGLLGSPVALVAAHATLALPFVVLVLDAAVSRIPRELESAAMSLGAGRPRALLDVTLRLLAPAIAAALVLAFLTSFDEVVVTSFVAGVGFDTLPKAMFDDVRTGVDPAIAAVGILMTIATALLLAVVGRIGRRAT